MDDAVVNRWLEGISAIGRSLDREVFLGDGGVPYVAPKWVTNCCGVEPSVAQQDYYVGVMSCPGCRRVLSSAEHESYSETHNSARREWKIARDLRVGAAPPKEGY